MERYVAFGIAIEADDAAPLDVRATSFMLALMEALDQPGVKLEAVESDPGLRRRLLPVILLARRTRRVLTADTASLLDLPASVSNRYTC